MCVWVERDSFLFLLDHFEPSVASCGWYFGWSFSFIVFCWSHGSICKLLSLDSFGGSHAPPSRSLVFQGWGSVLASYTGWLTLRGFLLAFGVPKGRIHCFQSLNTGGRKELCSLQNKQTKQKQLSWILFYKTVCITFSTVSRGYSDGMGAKVLSCPVATTVWLWCLSSSWRNLLSGKIRSPEIALPAGWALC